MEARQTCTGQFQPKVTIAWKHARAFGRRCKPVVMLSGVTATAHHLYSPELARTVFAKMTHIQQILVVGPDHPQRCGTLLADVTT